MKNWLLKQKIYVWDGYYKENRETLQKVEDGPWPSDNEWK